MTANTRFSFSNDAAQTYIAGVHCVERQVAGGTDTHLVCAHHVFCEL